MVKSVPKVIEGVDRMQACPASLRADLRLPPTMLVISAIRSRTSLAGSTSAGSMPSMPAAICLPKSTVTCTLKMPLTLPAMLRVPTMRWTPWPGAGSSSRCSISIDSIVPKVSVTEPRMCVWTSNSVIALI